MAKEAERLLDGSGWLPEPLRLVDVAPAPAEQEGEAERCPNSSPMTRTGKSLPTTIGHRSGRRMKSRRGTARAVPHPSYQGAGVQRRSPFLLAGLKRKSAAGKGLSRRGSGERRAVRPIPALPRQSSHDRISRRRRQRRAALDACHRSCRLRYRKGCAAAFDRSRTRPAHRCRRSAQRDGGRLRRLRCDWRLELEDRL